MTMIEPLVTTVDPHEDYDDDDYGTPMSTTTQRAQNTCLGDTTSEQNSVTGGHRTRPKVLYRITQALSEH